MSALRLTKIQNSNFKKWFNHHICLLFFTWCKTWLNRLDVKKTVIDLRWQTRAYTQTSNEEISTKRKPVFLIKWISYQKMTLKDQYSVPSLKQGSPVMIVSLIFLCFVSWLALDHCPPPQCPVSCTECVWYWNKSLITSRSLFFIQ